jgi:hypothetical protein
VTEDEQKLGAAAVELAVAAAGLRTTDDALVAYGREETGSYNDEAEYARARTLCENVSTAYATMRRAEEHYLDMRAKVKVTT